MDVIPQARNDSCKARDLSPSHCGILWLPNELLVDISYRVVSLYMADVEAFDAYEIPVRSWPPIIELPRPPRSNCYKWIVVSHICSRWRQVTLAIPRMWSTVVLSYNMMWVKTLLERSQRTPLTVIANVYWIPDEKRPEKDLVLQAARHNGISTLQIALHPSDVYPILTALSGQLPETSTTLLKAMDIRICPTTYTPTEPIPILSSVSLPSLQHLTFSCVPFVDEKLHWEWPALLSLVKQLIVPSLTRLHLLRFETPISTQTCLELLAALPSLEDLLLGEVLASSPQTTIPSRTLEASSLVHLPRLRKVALEGCSKWTIPHPWQGVYRFDCGVHAADVLQHLVMPTSVEISFAAAIDKADSFAIGHPLHFACGVLGDALRGSIAMALGPPYPSITHCYIFMSQVYELTFEFYIELCSFSEPAEDSPAEDSDRQCETNTVTIKKILGAQFRTEYRFLAESLCSVIESLGAALSSVRIVRIDGFVLDPWTPNELHTEERDRRSRFLDPVWKCIAEKMPEIEELDVSGHSPEYVKWLTRRSPSIDLGEPTLPCLRRLEVNAWDVNWRRNVEPYQLFSDDVVVTKGDFPRWMLEALTVWRKQHGEARALRCLTINNAEELHEEDIVDLRASGFIQQVNPLYD